MATVRLTERQWERQVLDLAKALGWRCAHFRPAKTAKGWRTPVQADGAGFPDLVLVRGTELIFAELKADSGRVRSAQEEWLCDLEQVAGALAPSASGDANLDHASCAGVGFSISEPGTVGPTISSAAQTFQPLGETIVRDAAQLHGDTGC